ncbi:MAG: primosomal protein N' [Peptoniphilaceae bacterium]|nr:primosomal protein N' [Peptoniphilaceae bacterium]MDY6019626.1 primosomal protein N' [Anaerococcus sp.]
MYAKVIIDSNSRFLDRSFTYHIPEKFNNKIDKGMRVIVPFGKGNKSTIAFIYEIISNIDNDFEVKDIIDLYDYKKIVSDELIDLAFFMNKRYISPIQSAIRQILPPGNIKELKGYYYSTVVEDDLTYFLKEKKSIDQIKDKFGNITDSILEYIKLGKIKVAYEIKTAESIKYKEVLNLNEEKSKTIRKNAKKQIDIVNFLKGKKDVDLSLTLSQTNSSRSSLNSLIDKRIVDLEKIEIKRKVFKRKNNYKKISLNQEQKNAFEAVLSDKSNSYLLKGVTGSGKTEVFLQLVEENLKEGKEAIILVPEISLTPQTIERFTGRFGEKIAVIHSGLSLSERFDQWRLIDQGEVKIVIGARSAIFAPFKNLGIIIIDEEHDQSYFSSKDPKYHTKEVAEFRRLKNDCTLLLASATPSISTMKETIDGKYKLLELKNRVNKTKPQIELVDMREELKASNYSMISRRLYSEISKNLSNKEQTILFLNKIGHNSFTFCRQCGYVIKCDACDVSMTYHKHINKLVCHYCGRTKNQPTICPNCGSKKIKEFGAGTEKLEEEIRRLFPKAKVLRMDSQTANKKDSYEKMYAIMKNNQVDILIGTQMIAKGLDFKNVTLVGIVSADLSLNFDDYSADESTYQLLTQVSGRAGRDKKIGRVIMQTYRPDNFVIQAAYKGDYNAFINKEMEVRKAFEYPPYTNLISIKIIAKSRIDAMDISKIFANKLRDDFINLENVRIIGPNPCKIERVNNKYRYNILVKAEDEILNEVIKIIEIDKNLFIKKYKDVSFIPALNPNNIN